MRKRRMIYLVLGVILFIISGIIGFKYFDSIKSYMSKYSSYKTATSVVENYRTNEDGTKKAIVAKYIVDGQAYFKISTDYYENPPIVGTLMQVKYNPESPSESVWDNDKMNIGIVVGIVVVALLGILSVIKYFVGSKVDDTSFEEKLEKMKERRIKEEVENYKIVPEKEEVEEFSFFKKKKNSKMLAAASNGKISVYDVDEKNNKIVEDTKANYSSITEENIIKENTSIVQKDEEQQANEIINDQITNEVPSDGTILKNKEPEEIDYDIPQDLSGYTKKDENIELNNQDYEIENKDQEIEDKTETIKEEKTQEKPKEITKNISNNSVEFDYNNNQTIRSIKLTESKDEGINLINEVQKEMEEQEVKVDISDIETKVNLDDLF